MSYNTGTMINPANPAETLLAQVKSQLTAHAAWSWVENYNDTGGQNYTHDIFKCSGTLNAIGSDFYIIFTRSRNAGMTQFYVWACESYSVATHACTRWTPPNPYQGSTLYPVAADGSYSTTTYVPNYYANISTQYLSCSTGVTDYWMVITANTFTLTTRPAPSATYAIHVGLFDSLVYQAATNDPFPLMVYGTNNQANSGANVMTTRHPFRAGLQTYGAFGHVLLGWTIPSQGGNSPVRVPAGDLFQNGAAIAGRWAIYTYANQYGNFYTQTAGYLRGLLKPEVLLINSDGSVSAGDTVQVAGHTYVNLNGNLWADTQAN